MKAPRVIGLVLVGAMALFAVGCSDDDSSTTTSSSDDAAMADDKMDDESMSDDAIADEEAVMVGGEAMLPSLNVVENASNAPNLTTLVAAVTQADLVDTLSGPGPFTVFAPDNDAFAKVDQATIDTLMSPEGKEDLTAILTYHVVPGQSAAADLSDGDTLTTVNGGTLTVGVDGGTVTLTDENGGVATVTQADVFQSNGVAHIIDSVLLPAS